MSTVTSTDFGKNKSTISIDKKWGPTAPTFIIRLYWNIYDD